MSAHLKRITSRAKQIRKLHPAMKWTSAIKQASIQLRKGKVSGIRRPAKKKFKKYAAVIVERPLKPRRRVGSPGVGIQTVGSIKGATRSQLENEIILRLEEKLGNYYVARDKAKLKRDKAKWQKLISETKSDLRKYKK